MFVCVYRASRRCLCNALEGWVGVNVEGCCAPDFQFHPFTPFIPEKRVVRAHTSQHHTVKNVEKRDKNSQIICAFAKNWYTKDLYICIQLMYIKRIKIDYKKSALYFTVIVRIYPQKMIDFTFFFLECHSSIQEQVVNIYYWIQQSINDSFEINK